MAINNKNNNKFVKALGTPSQSKRRATAKNKTIVVLSAASLVLFFFRTLAAFATNHTLKKTRTGNKIKMLRTLCMVLTPFRLNQLE